MPETGVGDGGIAAAERRRASGGDVGDGAQRPETDNGVDHAAAAQRHLVFAERQIARADDAEHAGCHCRVGCNSSGDYAACRGVKPMSW